MQGVGEAIADRQAAKVLLLNGSHDRETGTSADPSGADVPGGMSAREVVQAVWRSNHITVLGHVLCSPPLMPSSAFCTDVA